MNNRQHAETLIRLFVNDPRGYTKQWAQGETFGYVAIYEEPTAEVIENHLIGGHTISVPALNGQGMSKWCAFDSDTDDGHLEAVEKVLTDLGMSFFREGKRAGREGHCWLLFAEPVAAADLRIFGRQVLALSTVPINQVEFFPKQDAAPKLAGALRLPLGIHRKPGANYQRSWMEGPEKNIDAQVQWLEQFPLNQPERISRLAEAVRVQESRKRYPPRQLRVREFRTGENILDLLPPSHRRWSGREWIARCPICAAEGHDKHCDNLRIAANGEQFCCVYGGPGQVHKGADIIRYLK